MKAFDLTFPDGYSSNDLELEALVSKAGHPSTKVMLNTLNWWGRDVEAIKADLAAETAPVKFHEQWTAWGNVFHATAGELHLELSLDKRHLKVASQGPNGSMVSFTVDAEGNSEFENIDGEDVCADWTDARWEEVKAAILAA